MATAVATTAKATSAEKASARRDLLAAGRLLGVLEAEPGAWLTGGSPAGSPADAEVARLVAERDAARRARDFAGADRVRSALSAMGVIVEDGPAGTTWRRG